MPPLSSPRGRLPERTFSIFFSILSLAAVSCGGEIGGSGNPGSGGTGNGAGGGGGPGGTGGSPPLPPGVLDTGRIPSGHPRLFFDQARLSRAKQWYAANPFDPEEPIDAAFHYLLTGNTGSARQAIQSALNTTFSVSGTASDDARWEGETVILTYDWCHDQMTETERRTLIDRWNGYIDALNAKSWGGIGMEANNYYTGYMRNAIEWGIATWGENDRATAILEHGVTTRWTNSFLEFAESDGVGGVPHEGTQYGRGQMNYFTVPLTTMGLLGRNAWAETNHFKHMIYYFIYSMSPSPVFSDGGSAYETFPFSDDEGWLEGETAALQDVGTFLAPLVEVWQGTKLAGYVQRYLDLTEAPMARFAEAVRVTATPEPFDQLPLDYYAPGIRFFYTRSSWASDAMLINLQLGIPQREGHRHLDAGSFQIVRGGRWLSRETVSYNDAIAAWNNGPADDARAGYGHNTLLFQGRGPIEDAIRQPTVVRLESRPDHSYLAVDLTDAYRPEGGGSGPASKVVREFLFVRPLDSLVVLDRMRTGSASTVKSFIVHSETTAPMLSTGAALIRNGDQVLQVMTLVPSNAQSRSVNEGGEVGQYRLEVDTSGAAESAFLHVLHGRDMTAPALVASVEESSTEYRVTLTHPSRGSAVVVFQKGIDALGGSFGYAASGSPSPSPLIDGIQTQHITDDGPVWQ